MTTQLAVGSGEVCRLTVYSPASRVELAVPVHVPVADLLPTILGHLGPELATTGMEHGGWVLQRLGEPPLQEDLGAAALGLYDGDILSTSDRTTSNCRQWTSTTSSTVSPLASPSGRTPGGRR
jgi:hypothetical protein